MEYFTTYYASNCLDVRNSEIQDFHYQKKLKSVTILHLNLVIRPSYKNNSIYGKKR